MYKRKTKNTVMQVPLFPSLALIIPVMLTVTARYKLLSQNFAAEKNRN